MSNNQVRLFSRYTAADESQPLGGQLSVCPDLPAAGLQLLMPASAAAKVRLKLYFSRRASQRKRASVHSAVFPRRTAAIDTGH